jgi:hypothetical protein
MTNGFRIDEKSWHSLLRTIDKDGYPYLYLSHVGARMANGEEPAFCVLHEYPTNVDDTTPPRAVLFVPHLLRTDPYGLYMHGRDSVPLHSPPVEELIERMPVFPVVKAKRELRVWMKKFEWKKRNQPTEDDGCDYDDLH